MSHDVHRRARLKMMITKKEFEAKYNQMVKDFHEGRTYRSFFTFDGGNHFCWVPVQKETAFGGGFRQAIEDEGFVIRRLITYDVQASCHLSVVMPREQDKLSRKKLQNAEMKWYRHGGQVRFQITGATTYFKNGIHYAALLARCADIFEIREEIGLERCPPDFQIHITLGEGES